MFRLTSTFAVLLFICISSFSIDAASRRVRGGFSKVSEDKFNELQENLQNSNFQSALGADGSGVVLQKIDSATRKVAAGMNYRIEATVLDNGKPEKCCFSAHHGLALENGERVFNVKCAQCGQTCDCFKSG